MKPHILHNNDIDDKMGSVGELHVPESGEISSSNKNSVPVLEKVAAFNIFLPFANKDDVNGKKQLDNIVIQLSIQTDRLVADEIVILRNKQVLSETDLKQALDGKGSKTKIIELSNDSLTKVPIDTLRQFQCLTALSLSRNKIALLPPVFLSWFPKLIYLDLSCNRIASFSEDFFNPHIHDSVLSFLNLSSNGLKCLPKSIKLLKCLEVLDLLSNDLVSLPVSMGKLLKLNILKLSWMLYLSPFSTENVFSRSSTVKITDLLIFLREMSSKKFKSLSFHQFILKFSQNPQGFGFSDHLGRNILHMAIFRDDMGVARHLSQHHPSLMLEEDVNKINPFIFSLKEKKYKFAELFIQKGVDVNCEATTYGSALHLAVRGLKLKLTILLVAKGASLLKKDFLGDTVLHVALRVFPLNKIKAAKMVMFLVAQGVPMNAMNFKNDMAIHVPARENCSSCVRFLLSLNDDIVAFLNTGERWYPLEKWNMLGNESLSSESDDETNPEKPEETGEKKSMQEINKLACAMLKKTERIWDKKMNERVKATFELIQSKNDVDKRFKAEPFNLEADDDNGNTILHLAAIHPNIQMLVAIGKRKANPFAENYQGLTPLQLVPWDFLTSRKTLIKIERGSIYRRYKINKFASKKKPIPPSEAMRNFMEGSRDLKGGKRDQSLSALKLQMDSESNKPSRLIHQKINLRHSMDSLDRFSNSVSMKKTQTKKPKDCISVKECESQKPVVSLRLISCNDPEEFSRLLLQLEMSNHQQDLLVNEFSKELAQIKQNPEKTTKFSEILLFRRVFRILVISSTKLELLVKISNYLEENQEHGGSLGLRIREETLKNLVLKDQFFKKDMNLMRRICQKLNTLEKGFNLELTTQKILGFFGENWFFDGPSIINEDLSKKTTKKLRQVCLISMVWASRELGSRGYFDGKAVPVLNIARLKRLFVSRFPFLSSGVTSLQRIEPLLIPKNGAKRKEEDLKKLKFQCQNVERSNLKGKAGAGENDMIYWEMDKEMNESEENYDLVKKKNFENGILAFNHTKTKCKSDLD